MKLPLKFYRRDTITVAKELLGKKLVRILNGKKLSGLIVETEAYIGVDDLASHARRGLRTARNEVMYLEGGHAYVYFIYGMYYCLNFVTKDRDQPEAVLIRAITPLDGLDEMLRLRNVSRPLKTKASGNSRWEQNLTNGPGKLCLALDIDRKLNGEKLNGRVLYCEDGPTKVRARDIMATPRIGVDYAGDAAKWPLRFLWEGSPKG